MNHHDVSNFDPEPIIGKILAVLDDIPRYSVDGIIIEVKKRFYGKHEAVKDSDISVLHEWGLMSNHCYATLMRNFQKNKSIFSEKLIKLSDVSGLSLAEISTMSNLGKWSRMEIFIILEECGLTSHDVEIIPLLSAIDRQTLREKTAKRIALQHAARDRDRVLLNEFAGRGADWQAFAKQLGCTGYALRGKVAAAARRVAFRDANPMSMPNEDPRRRSRGAF